MAPPARVSLFCSLLRCCSLQGEQARAGDRDVHEHYTPPPMLCPRRAGTGLYCNLASRRQQRAQTVRLQNSDGEFDNWAPAPVTCRRSEIAPSVSLDMFCRECHLVCVHFSFFFADFLEAASPTPGTLTTKTTKPYVMSSHYAKKQKQKSKQNKLYVHTNTNHRVINEGRDFQADIPPLQQWQDADSDSHNALLLWTVEERLEHPDTQLRSKSNACTQQ